MDTFTAAIQGRKRGAGMTEEQTELCARIKLVLVAAIVNMRDDAIWELIEKAYKEVQDAESEVES